MNEETKNKIKELEEELENKEIMINALLNEIKKMKNKRKMEEENEIKKRVKNNMVGIRMGDDKNEMVGVRMGDDKNMVVDLWNTEPLEKVNTVQHNNNNINTMSQGKPSIVNTSPQGKPPLVYTSLNSRSNINTSPQINTPSQTRSSLTKSPQINTPLLTNTPLQPNKIPLRSLRDKKKLENSLKDQLDSLINHKRINKGLGNHCFFEEFVDFCVDTLPFTFGPSQPEIKQIVKSYMIQNSSQISGFLCKNINSYSLLQIYSPLNCLSTILSPLESCIIFHDILLMIDDYTRLHFVFHALFKNKIDNGVLGSTILNLISYQLKVDLDLYKSKKSIINNLSSLKCNYELPKSSKSLEDYLLDLTKPFTVFNKKMINENIYEYVFSIRILTHYLDWDYTFNTYFNEYLYPRLEEDDSYLLLLGICNFNFYRIFGEIESTKMVNDLLKSKMEKVTTTSILSYLLIKQIDPLKSSIWLEENTKELIDQGWSIEYLTKYLIF